MPFLTPQPFADLDSFITEKIFLTTSILKILFHNLAQEYSKGDPEYLKDKSIKNGHQVICESYNTKWRISKRYAPFFMRKYKNLNFEHCDYFNYKKS